MKQVLFLILLFQSTLSYSKDKTATIKFYEYGKLNVVESWKWKINGVELSIANPSVQFPVHYPKFDTIIYTRNDSAKAELIISRFTPGLSYIITFNGCCETFDISDNDNSNYPKNYVSQWPDTIAMKLESGTVQFKTINYSDTTTLVGSFGDIYGGYTRGILLANNTLSEKKSPFLLPYSNYINHVIIGKAQFVNTDTIDEEWYNREFHIVLKDPSHPEAKYLEEFVNFQCRFFNRENLVVIYDCKTGEMQLEIQEY